MEREEEADEQPEEVQEEKGDEEETKEAQEEGNKFDDAEKHDEVPEEKHEVEQQEDSGEIQPKEQFEDYSAKQEEEDDKGRKDEEEKVEDGQEAKEINTTEGDDTQMQETENAPAAEPAQQQKSETKPESREVPETEPNLEDFNVPEMPTDPKLQHDMEIIKNHEPSSELEQALTAVLSRKEKHIDRLSGEVQKLKAFISKRKQTYKRKRKDEGAPTRALSAYNIFVQDRFSRLAKENEQALRSADSDAQLKRVPPASLVASTGNEWKELPSEQKAAYEERAREDRKRYEDQMAKYQPPDKTANRKRNKTGYNMFFSAHVLRLKQSEAGVPSERGSVARLVGNAWKQLSAEDKQYYEREADKQNGMNPVEKVEEEEDEEAKRAHMDQYGHPVHPQHMHGGEMHGGMPPPMGQHGQPMHPSHHDPRGQHPGYYPGYHMPHGQYPPPQHQHYDQQYQQHYQQPPPPPPPHDSRRQHRSSSSHNYPPPPPPAPQGHYDQHQRGMGV